MIELKDVFKKYDSNNKYSVKDFNLEIEDGEFIVFVGPSGCGKSTTLRMIAGLEEISGGELIMDGEIVNEKHPKDRNIAMVFQDYALYPHMTVAENMGFGLKVQKVNKKEIEDRVSDAASIVGLEEFLDKRPGNLSGGQRQRVALGRAIVRHPKLFLMDEPLSNLDAKLRVSMRVEITSLQKRLGVTTIYVTHDQVEAMTMADRIVVMCDGEIQQIGTPTYIYDNPRNLFVAKFIGQPQMNILESEFVNGGIMIDGKNIKLPSGVISKLGSQYQENRKINLGIRPEHIYLDNMRLESGLEHITPVNMTYRHFENMGHEIFIYANLMGSDCIVKTGRQNDITWYDEVVKTGLDLNHAHFFDYETTNNLILEEEDKNAN